MKSYRKFSESEIGFLVVVRSVLCFREGAPVGSELQRTWCEAV